MKIKTVENLLGELDEDLIWRTKELQAIKSLVEKSSGSDLKLNHRVGIALLYAHWEGYIKNSSICYILYLSQFSFKYEELTENFIALSLQGSFKNCANSHKVSDQCSVVNTLINNLDHETRIRDKVHEEVIPKIAILDSKLFFEILFILGLKKSPFELKQHLIDNVLVPNRNDVVHGRNPSITKDEFDKSFKGVTEMLELFRKEIIIAAKSKSYKKIP